MDSCARVQIDNYTIDDSTFCSDDGSAIYLTNSAYVPTIISKIERNYDASTDEEVTTFKS